MQHVLLMQVGHALGDVQQVGQQQQLQAAATQGRRSSVSHGHSFWCTHASGAQAHPSYCLFLQPFLPGIVDLLCKPAPVAPAAVQQQG
jgi:hypothetical protein